MRRRRRASKPWSVYSRCSGKQLDSGSLVCTDIPRESPLMRWFGRAKDDPDFDAYLDEIRKYREEVDRHADHGSDPSERSDTSSTATT